MSVSLKNFVNININYHETTTLSGSRETIVLLGNSGVQFKYLAPDGRTIVSLNDATITSPDVYKENDEALTKYIKYFFSNGGKIIHYINVEKGKESEKLKTLPMEEIVIVFFNMELNDAITLVKTINQDSFFTGIYEKMFVAYSNTLDDITNETILNNVKNIENLVIKYIGDSVDPGFEMSVAAYLSKINVYYGTINDYNFTIEKVNEDDEVDSLIDDNSIVEKILANNFNADIILTGDSVNIGGNTTSGKDLVNHFYKIMLTQTLTQRLCNVLKSKLRYNQTGLNIISNTIVDELNRYRTNGYLSTNKVWEEEDWVVEQTTIIKKDTLLSLGYKFVIMPFSSLTDEERKKHQLPKIYLLIADSYAIRLINIVGEVY